MNKKVPYQDGLTIITPVISEKIQELYDVLDQIGKDVEDNDLISFADCRRIHFIRWVVLGESEDSLGNHIPASLVLSTNYDTPVRDHLEELYKHGSKGLHLIYSCCEGYPPPELQTQDKLIDYLLKHDQGRGTLYVGTRGMTGDQIIEEAKLRDSIEQFLDEEDVKTGLLEKDPDIIRQQILEFVRSRDDLSWALSPISGTRKFWPYHADIYIVCAVLGLFIGIPVIVGFINSFWSGVITFFVILIAVAIIVSILGLMLRAKERRDPQDPATTSYQHVAELTMDEDISSGGQIIVQNQMSSATNIKPGWLRLLVLRVVLWAIDVAGRYVFTKGKLGTIPSIHFARWVIIDKGRRLLFFSNFDGSWENYLGDFIDKAAVGLTAVWSNTSGFPKSRWLIHDGATDELRFKAYARSSQTTTEVWYSAYKYLSVQNIQNNRLIRNGLSESLSPEETIEWLKLF